MEVINRLLRWRQYGGLGLLLAIYLPLTLAYSYVIPFSKGPDEYINYQYILFIAKHHRLPATYPERQEAGVKADWQPLYHLVAGMAAAAVDLTPPPALKVTWQPLTRQLIDLVLPRATLIRTEDERPPYRGVYLLWQAGRWVSLALGAGTLIVAYLISLTLWPGQPAVATGVTALLVFTPRFLFTHAVLSDDTLLGFCLALYLLFLARLAMSTTGRRPDTLVARQTTHNLQPPLSLVLGLGITAGLAIVTKYTAIPAAVGALISLLLIAPGRQEAGPRFLRSGLVFVGALSLAVSWWVGWVWWHFNQVDRLGLVRGLIMPLLPGASVDDNPTTARLTALLSGQSLADLGEAPGAGGSYLDWVWHSFTTYWGVTVFGAEPAWPYPYPVILAGLALFCLAALAGFWRVYRSETEANRLIWRLFSLHGLLFVPLPLLRFMLSHRLNDAAQGRHLLIPAGPAIAIILIAGWLAWFRPHRRGLVALLTGGAMLSWALAHLVYLGAAYPPPLPVRTTPGPQVQVTQPTQINFGDILRLTGYQTQPSADRSTLRLDLLWQSLAPAPEDYRTEITLVDRQGQPHLRWLSHPAAGRFPLRAWQPGDMVRDRLYLPVAGLPPAEYDLRLRLLGWDAPLPSDRGETVALTTIALTPASVPPGIILWQQGEMVAGDAPWSSGVLAALPRFLARFPPPPIYRYRSTIPVTSAQAAAISLVDPSGRRYAPLSEIGPLRLFMVNYDWPSGDYRLEVDNQATPIHLQVRNFDQRPGGWQFTPPAIPHPVQANFANQVQLLGYDLPERRVEAGGGIPLLLYWQGLTQMRQDYTIFVQLLDANLQRRGGYDRLPRENYSTTFWVPGEVVSDGFAVPVQPDAPDGIYTIRVGLYRQENGQAVSLPLVQNGRPVTETSVALGPVKVGGPPPGVTAAAATPQVKMNVVLGGQIELLGFDLTQSDSTPLPAPLRLPARATWPLRLTLYWQCLARTDSDYTVFVHLRDATGQIVAQVDGPPAAGRYPTSLWEAAEIIPDEFSLNLPPGIAPGRYQLAAGLYDPLSGARLPVAGTPDNSLILTEVELN